MRKLFVKTETNTVGTGGYYFIEVPDDMTEAAIEDIIWNLALENADMHGIYPPSDSWPEFSDDEDEEDYDEGDDNIGGCYTIYDPKKHDRYTYNGIPQWIQY